MRKIAIILLLTVPVIGIADTYVKGYYRKDGTYVQPHYRSDANKTDADNWSTEGNVNPYTGKRGTEECDDC